MDPTPEPSPRRKPRPKAGGEAHAESYTEAPRPRGEVVRALWPAALGVALVAAFVWTRRDRPRPSLGVGAASVSASVVETLDGRPFERLRGLPDPSRPHELVIATERRWSDRSGSRLERDVRTFRYDPKDGAWLLTKHERALDSGASKSVAVTTPSLDRGGASMRTKSRFEFGAAGKKPKVSLDEKTWPCRKDECGGFWISAVPDAPPPGTNAP